MKICPQLCEQCKSVKVKWAYVNKPTLWSVCPIDIMNIHDVYCVSLAEVKRTSRNKCLWSIRSRDEHVIESVWSALVDLTTIIEHTHTNQSAVTMTCLCGSVSSLASEIQTSCQGVFSDARRCPKTPEVQDSNHRPSKALGPLWQ